MIRRVLATGLLMLWAGVGSLRASPGEIMDKLEGETMVVNVCNLDRIYTEAFNYSLPRSVLEGWLAGKGFPQSTDYTPSERQRLERDINALYNRQMDGAFGRQDLVATITAGAPGAGKTVLLEQLLECALKEGKRCSYIDPDAVCLKRGMLGTYSADLALTQGNPEERRDLYHKWRAGSNASAHLILANWVKSKLPFFFGTTSTGPATGKFFEFLKGQGYQIHLIHVTAPDDVRWQSIQKRDQEFIQTTEVDTQEKGLLLPQRIRDAYLKYADRIGFFWRSSVEADATLVAEWTRQDADSGELNVLDPALFEAVKAVHNRVVEILQKPELRWENTVEKHSLVREAIAT